MRISDVTKRHMAAPVVFDESGLIDKLMSFHVSLL